MFLGDIRRVSQQVYSFNWIVYPFVLALTLFNYTLRFGKWHYYLGQIGIRNFSIHRSARIFIAGFPLAMTPGKVGEALKGVWLHRDTGVETAKGVAVVVAERISDGLAVLALSIFSVIAYPDFWPIFASVLVFLLTIVIVSQIRPLALWLLDLGEKLPLINRIVFSLRRFYEGSFLLFKPKPALIAVGLGTISWLGEGIGFYLVLLGLGVPPSSQVLASAVFILAFSLVIGAVSTLPGGLGAAEISIAGMLVLILGLDRDLAAAATLLIRFATLWFAVGLGLIVWLFSPDLLGLGGKHTDVINDKLQNNQH